MTRVLSLAECLLTSESYFGTKYSARQGDISRQKYFLPTANYICNKFEGPIRVLEIGSWAGASTISWVKAFIDIGIDVEITCVDHWEPYFDLAINNSIHYRTMNAASSLKIIQNIFLHNIKAEGVDRYVKILKGSSKVILPTLKKESYHLIYIDDIQSSKNLIIPGGVICGDDLERQFIHLTDYEIQQHKNNLYKDFIEADLFSYHPGVTQAVYEEFGEVQLWDGYWGLVWSGNKKLLALDLNNLIVPSHLDFEDYDTFQLEQNFDIYDLLKYEFRIDPKKVVLIHQGILGYNIIMLNNKFMASPQSAGPINFSLAEVEKNPTVIVDEVFSNLINKIINITIN